MAEERIAVLVRRFPKLSETFILGEIDSLVERGLDIVIFSIDRPNEEKCQPEVARLLPQVVYLDRPTALAAATALLGYLYKRPSQALKVIKTCITERPNLRVLAALLIECERFGINHLHAHYISEPALLAESAARLIDASFSVSAHAKDIYMTRPKIVRRRLRNARFVATCTAYNVKFLREIAPRQAQHVHLIYHGIDGDRFCPKPQSTSSTAPLILAIGRFKKKKGFDVLIDACAALVAQGVDLRCEIIGYGDQQSALENQIRTCRVENHVSLKDPIDHSELPDLIRDATAFVLPCRIPEDGDRDGIPNSLLEAMACGIPVISTHVSGIPEVIDSGANGLLVPPDDPTALSDAIRRVVGDPQLSTRLGVSARKTITARFDWQVNIQLLCNMLDTRREMANRGERTA